ncbi:leucine-rich repeat-containing protein [Tanacetum coccineum]
MWFNTTSATSFGYQFFSAAGGADNTCIDKESQALLDFKAHLQDPYDMLYTWRPEEKDDCCQWEGVKCNNQTGHVTELRLSQIEGEITPSLLNLTYLNHLELSANSFHGTIPEFICSMTHLTHLQFTWNQFTGTIPESIGNMTQLTRLDLHENSFSGSIPISIGSLTSLTYLDLHGNSFSGPIPTSISSLTKLTKLWLSGNNFSGVIPTSIGSLTKLTVLSLSDNSLYGTIPTEYGNLTNLESLSLGDLRSSTVENIDWLSSLSNLRTLKLDRTSLAKANNWVNLIRGLPNLSSLSLVGCDLSQVMHPYSPSVNSSLSIDSLYLANNNLNSSMFRWLCPLVGNKLTTLSLSRNKFHGKLSDFLNNLSGCTSSTLEYMDASSNQFTGSLSDEIQTFSSLIQLNLSSNELDGTISDKLWQLPILEELDLSSNSLRGAISKNIGKSNLLYIDLSNNSLEGVPFYDDVSNLSESIRYIDFSSNKLGPGFPKWIQKLKNLDHLDLSKNSILDTVSKEYWNQWQSSQLSYLDLSFNSISGAILNVPSTLLVLDLSKNKLSGGISFLCQIVDGFLSFFDISDNSFTGPIPDCLWHLKELVVLNLANNSLSGRIPASVKSLIKLEALYLYNNNLFGELTSSLKHCTNLTFLNLGANKFSGNVPVWIGENLSRLYVLSLASNNFYGTIPSQLCRLVNLQLLDLSMNNLKGTIPPCINNLTAMVQDTLSLKGRDFVTLDITQTSGERYTPAYGYSDDHVIIQWQGKVREFSRNLKSLKSIDLSSNHLTGHIPCELTNLYQLFALNLSKNALLGEIPSQIGQMKELLALDLSRNNLSGQLPSSMSRMNFLSYLDVSHNNLSGRIPSGTQLQSFEASMYIGNAGLCGHPLAKSCPGDKVLEITPVVDERKSDGEAIDELQRWFYIGGTAGFATGFCIVVSALLLNRRGRRAFFHFHDRLKDSGHVKVLLFIAKWRRVVRA